MKNRILTLLLFCSVAQINAGKCADTPLPLQGKPTPPKEVYSRHRMLIGRWYEESPTREGGFKQALEENNSDGTFRIDFRITDSDGNVESQTEAGYWGVTGSLLIRMTTGVLGKDGMQNAETDRANGYFWDAYDIKELSEAKLVEKHTETGDINVQKKVNTTFTMPDHKH